MNTLIIATLSSLAVLATGSGIGHVGSIVSGPSGVVTDHGPIGPNGPAGVGVGLGIGHGAAIGVVSPAVTGSILGARAALIAPSATTVISGHGLGLGGVGLGLGGVGLGGVGLGGVGLGEIGIGLGGLGVGHGVGLNGLGLVNSVGVGVGLGHGIGGISNGGGTIGIGHGGVVVRGPGTVPATIAGPSGKIVADGLWGPTLATGNGGHGGHGW